VEDYVQKRTLLWWICAALAPLGLVGGPIELATLSSGLIQWHGPLGYIVDFWHSTISEPFHVLLSSAFHLAQDLFKMPRWTVPTFATDYTSVHYLIRPRADSPICCEVQSLTEKKVGNINKF
jgi:hypothetical protein